MAEVRETIRVDAPVTTVWAVLADIGTISDWNPGVRESHQTSNGSAVKGAASRVERIT